jgi:putative transposase
MKALLALVQSQCKKYLPDLKCFHLVLDGFYGHGDYLHLAASEGLKIVSKFKSNAALILPYLGPQLGKGRPRYLGNKVQLDQISPHFYQTTLTDSDSNLSTLVYQLVAFTPKISGIPLNIVVLVHTHLKSKKVSRTILFSNDLSLDALTLIKYYSLRFQIEFDFRDAKQFYGLSDFKNYKQAQLTNAVNLAFTMTLLGKLVLEKYRIKLNCPTMGILDLKTVLRTQKCAQILLNQSQLDLDQFLNNPLCLKMARLEAIHI